MRIKPLRDNILLEPVKEEKKKGGIILPETVEKDRPEKGRVLAVGPGKFDQHSKRIPLDVRKGDVVLFTKYGPNEIKVEDKKSGKEVEYLIAKEEDILAIIE
jgi:chaperonin GroES